MLHIFAGNLKTRGLDRSLCVPFSHTVMCLLSILRITRNSRWMGKDWSPFWPLSLHHRLIVCWLFLPRPTPKPAIHTATKKIYNIIKKILLFICLPLLHFIDISLAYSHLASPSPRRRWHHFFPLFIPFAFPYAFIEDNALDRWGGVLTLFLFTLKKSPDWKEISYTL